MNEHKIHHSHRKAALLFIHSGASVLDEKGLQHKINKQYKREAHPHKNVNLYAIR